MGVNIDGDPIKNLLLPNSIHKPSFKSYKAFNLNNWLHITRHKRFHPGLKCLIVYRSMSNELMSHSLLSRYLLNDQSVSQLTTWRWKSKKGYLWWVIFRRFMHLTLKNKYFNGIVRLLTFEYAMTYHQRYHKSSIFTLIIK